MQQQSPSSKAAGDRWPLASRAGQFPRYAALQDARPFQRSTHTRAPPPRSLECWGWGAGERGEDSCSPASVEGAEPSTMGALPASSHTQECQK